MKRPNDFVLDLLNEKKLPLKEKEKLLQLVVKEIKLGSQMDSKIWDEINKLKDVTKGLYGRDLNNGNLIQNLSENHSPNSIQNDLNLNELNNTPVKNLPDGEYLINAGLDGQIFTRNFVVKNGILFQAEKNSSSEEFIKANNEGRNISFNEKNNLVKSYNINALLVEIIDYKNLANEEKTSFTKKELLIKLNDTLFKDLPDGEYTIEGLKNGNKLVRNFVIKGGVLYKSNTNSLADSNIELYNKYKDEYTFNFILALSKENSSVTSYQITNYEILKKNRKDDNQDVDEQVSQLNEKVENIRVSKNVSTKFIASGKGHTDPHTPLHTISFLKKFKYVDQSELKDLVHLPFDSDNFDLFSTLNNVKRLPHFSNELLGIQESFEYKLPYAIYKATIDLIKLIDSEGVVYFKKHKQHPMFHKPISDVIQKFKCNYRFGSENSESSILQEALLNTARKCQRKNSALRINLEQVIYFNPPDVNIFKSKASFFTWVPSILSALKWIFENTIKHSNIKGANNFDSSLKKIEISVNRLRDKERGLTLIELIITDHDSYLLKDPETFINDLINSEMNIYILRSIADWRVECYHPEEKGMIFNILHDGEPSFLTSDKVGEYFKHIITFYD